jgi:hypothetical protein
MSKRAIINLVSSDEGDDDWHPTDDEAAAILELAGGTIKLPTSKRKQP